MCISFLSSRWLFPAQGLELQNPADLERVAHEALELDAQPHRLRGDGDRRLPVDGDGLVDGQYIRAGFGKMPATNVTIIKMERNLFAIYIFLSPHQNIKMHCMTQILIGEYYNISIFNLYPLYL